MMTTDNRHFPRGNEWIVIQRNLFNAARRHSFAAGRVVIGIARDYAGLIKAMMAYACVIP